MEAALNSEQYQVRQLIPANRTRNLGGNRFEVDLSSPESLKQLRTWLVGADGRQVGALFSFLALAEPYSRIGHGRDSSPLPLARWLFNVLKEFEPDLRASAGRGGGWAFNFTSLDGKFGLTGGPLPVAQAATIGMFKTLKRESPQLRVKTIDLDTKADAQVLFSRLFAELEAEDGLVEIGIDQNGRWKLELVEEPPLPEDEAPLELDSQSVLLVTGGAYGVTAEVSKLLAARYRPRLVLVGRSKLPSPEGPQTASLADRAALRQHLIQSMRRENPAVLPVEIERAVGRILKDREIRANLEAMRETGSAVEYHAMDVRDPDLFGGLLDGIYDRYGRLDGVIHGAGIIADNLIAQKSLQAFSDVLSTKVESALVLAEKIRPSSLKFFVLFSSISGRFGNAGQIDYSAANEFLNKLAVHLQAQWPGRVIAVNWGPWDGGMVSDELRRMYRTKGIGLISPAHGSQMLLRELSIAKSRKPEVLMACNVKKLAAVANMGGQG